MNELSRSQILQASELALRQADVAGVFPTPLSEVRTAVGIRNIIDISQLPDDVSFHQPGLLKRILGAYLFRSETAFVDLNQTDGRKRFTEGHEIGHKIIPWHADSYYLDGEEHLSSDTKDLLEQEANYAAACLIFQGARFHAHALQYEVSIRTPVKLAPAFGASFHATIRYYVEQHPDKVALVIAGRYPLYGGSLPVWRSVESPSFYSQFGSFVAALPGGTLRLNQDNPYSEVAGSALQDHEVPRTTVRLEHQRAQTFTLEGFFNGRSLFLMISPHRLLRTGRRIRLMPAPEA